MSKLAFLRHPFAVRLPAALYSGNDRDGRAAAVVDIPAGSAIGQPETQTADRRSVGVKHIYFSGQDMSAVSLILPMV